MLEQLIEVIQRNENDNESVQKILDDNPEIINHYQTTKSEKYIITPLSAAIDKGHLTIAKMLVQKGAIDIAPTVNKSYCFKQHPQVEEGGPSLLWKLIDPSLTAPTEKNKALIDFVFSLVSDSHLNPLSEGAGGNHFFDNLMTMQKLNGYVLKTLVKRLIDMPDLIFNQILTIPYAIALLQALFEAEGIFKTDYVYIYNRSLKKVAPQKWNLINQEIDPSFTTYFERLMGYALISSEKKEFLQTVFNGLAIEKKMLFVYLPQIEQVLTAHTLNLPANKLLSSPYPHSPLNDLFAELVYHIFPEINLPFFFLNEERLNAYRQANEASLTTIKEIKQWQNPISLRVILDLSTEELQERFFSHPKFFDIMENPALSALAAILKQHASSGIPITGEDNVLSSEPLLSTELIEKGQYLINQYFSEGQLQKNSLKLLRRHNKIVDQQSELIKEQSHLIAEQAKKIEMLTSKFHKLEAFVNTNLKDETQNITQESHSSPKLF